MENMMAKLNRLSGLVTNDPHAAFYGLVPRDRARVVRSLLEEFKELSIDVNRPLEGHWRSLLAEAAYMGNTDIVLLLLDGGADINAVGGKFGTALAAAAYGGNTDSISLLLDLGADIQAVGGDYGTALAAAAYMGNTDSISLLLDRGADIQAVGGDYGTALAAAAYTGKTESISLLVDRGADINAVGGKYGTAMVAAAYWGETDSISLLLDRGADINLVGGEYGTALAAAAYMGNTDIISLLLDRGADINLVGGKYGTALAAAASGGHTDSISLLLDLGADINAVGGKYGTVLAAAAYEGKTDRISLLLDRGADINAVGGKYGTALAAAAYGGNTDSISLLLDRGADINAVGGKYGTALAAAAYRGNTDIVSLLLLRLTALAETGDAVTGKYGSALGIAAYNGLADTVRILLNNGADATSVGGAYKTRFGVYPTGLDAAMAEGSKDNPEVRTLLTATIHVHFQSLATATDAGQPAVLDFTSNQNTNINEHDATIRDRSPFPMPFNGSYPGTCVPNCRRGGESDATAVLSSMFHDHGADPAQGLIAIGSERANALCVEADEEELVRSLVALVGLRADIAERLHGWIQGDVRYFIARNFDLGLAYAAARVAWKNFNDDGVDDDSISAQRGRWHWHAKRLDKARSGAMYIDKESGKEVIKSPYSIMPRRIWDLKSNRVVEFGMLHAAYLSVATKPDQSSGCPPYWAISHSWTKSMHPTITSINQYQWPVPLPEGLELDSNLRLQLLDFGAEYIWLDVLCLRQHAGDDTHTDLDRVKKEEWKLDVPTIGNIYRLAERIVRYFNGLGMDFSQDGWDDTRHWLRRAWTLQEIRMEHTTINGGVSRDMGRVFMNVRGKVSGQETTLRRAIRPVLRLAEVVDTPGGCSVYDMAREMAKRHSAQDVDKLSGLFYLLRTSELPCYDEGMSPEDFWRRSFHLLPTERKVEILIDFPYRGSDQQWFPTWVQMMSWPERDPDYEHISPDYTKLELTIEEPFCIRSMWAVASVLVHPTGDSKEYEVQIGNRFFGFYTPYLSQERINTELCKNLTLVVPHLRNAHNWVVCETIEQRVDKLVGGRDEKGTNTGVAGVNVLKKVGVLRTDSLNEILLGRQNGRRVLEQIECLFV